MNVLRTLKTKRGAVNVEYILLVVVGALAVVVGLGLLGTAMNTKHEGVANALNGKAVPTIVSSSVDQNNGDDIVGVINASAIGHVITWTGGIAPFHVLRSYYPGMDYSVELDQTNDRSATAEPNTGDNYYLIVGGDGAVSNIVHINGIEQPPDFVADNQ